MLYFHKHEVNQKGNGFEVILHITPHPTLEEFAEEFGLTKKAEEDLNRIAIGYVNKKFPTLRVQSIKVMMGGVLVTSIMFGGSLSQAFAEENTTVQAETETATYETTTETNVNADEEAGVTTLEEVGVEESSLTDEGTDTSPVEEESATDDTVPIEEVPMKEPGLVPGDFFYFVEAMAEKVQLALTFDDTAKAELISLFANERIAEANALFEAGDTDAAIALLNQALEDQELALDYVSESEGVDTTGEDLGSLEGDFSPNENEGIMPPSEDEVAVSDDSTSEDPASDVRDQLQSQFSQNVTALLLAMEKVENPKAKAALAKNVEKAYARMEKKLGKMKEIEERIASAIPVDEVVEDLPTDIRNDQEDFERELAEVEGEANATGVIPPIAPKAQEKAPNLPSQAKKGVEKAQAGQQKGQENQAEKRAVTPTPKKETKTPLAEEKASGNVKADITAGKKTGGNNNDNANANINPEAKAGGNGKAKVETERKAAIEASTEVVPISKGNNEKGNQGKGNGRP